VTHRMIPVKFIEKWLDSFQDVRFKCGHRDEGQKAITTADLVLRSALKGMTVLQSTTDTMIAVNICKVIHLPEQLPQINKKLNKGA